MAQPKPKIRLYVPELFAGGRTLALGPKDSHYLANVMRSRAGDAVAIFNGHDGEWLAEIAQLDKKKVTLKLTRQLGAQACVPDIWLAFCPIRGKTELVVEKAVELGVSRLLAVNTQYGVVKGINQEKMAAHAKEAAEQCGRCEVPPIEEYRDLRALLGAWPKERTLLYGDESGHGAPMKTLLETLPAGKYAILIGPEGGFSSEEHALLRQLAFVKGFSMGPRILRADTAAVAALACLMSTRGDWEKLPSFRRDDA